MLIPLRQRHPCQRRLAVLRVIHRCFRSSRIEGRQGCIDVGGYKHFQSGFLTNNRRLVADDVGQYDNGGYSSDHEPPRGKKPGSARGPLIGIAGGLVTWRPVLPDGRVRGNLMLCFWFTHVSSAHSCCARGLWFTADVTTTLIHGVMIETRTERRQVRFPPPSCFVPVFVPDRRGSRIAFVTKLRRGTWVR